ncbi:MAG: hypothetical protein AB9869_18225 [Verrucomicrobiia bacterium]
MKRIMQKIPRVVTDLSNGRMRQAGCVLVLAAMCVGAWLVERAPAATVSDDEMDLAVMATLNAVLTNSACPADWAGIEAAANAFFPMLHPTLIARERLADPAAVEADAEKAWSLLNPEAEHLRRMADPEYRAHVAAALEGLQSGMARERGW